MILLPPAQSITDKLLRNAVTIPHLGGLVKEDEHVRFVFLVLVSSIPSKKPVTSYTLPVHKCAVKQIGSQRRFTTYHGQ